MGLFSAKLCPVCGGTTPKLLAKKVDGQPICAACADDIMADSDIVKKWSIEDLRAHLSARKQNLVTVSGFTPSRTVPYEHEAVIDDARRLFFIRQFTVDNPPVFSFDDIVGYTVELGYRTVERWSRGAARTPYKPPELGILGGIAALGNAFKDDDKNDSKCESLTVTLQLNTPALHEYELCDILIDGDDSTAYALCLSREIVKVNIICDLIISLTA